MVQDANKLVVFGSQIVAVFIVIVGLWTQQSALQSPRPVGGKGPTSISTDRYGDRFARLWDDPFPEVSALSSVKPPPGGTSPTAAAQSSVDATAPAPSPSDSLPPIADNPEDARPSPPPGERSKFSKLLIWNLLDARQVPEMKERRLRIRYATVSAVLSADYLPARESSLSRLTGKSPTLAAQEGKDLIGYFETFRAVPNSTARYQRVILVWTPKELLQNGVINRETIDNVKQEIERRDDEGTAGELDVRVLHHGGSQDLEDYANAPNPDLEGRISFMRATLAGKFDPFRTLVTDDRLIDALFDELSLRIPPLNTPSLAEENRPRIMFVIERDTRYSHAIKEEVEAKFGPRARLEFCSYLRGLDGRSETGPSAADSPKSESPEKAADDRKGSGQGESSLGASQFDYLRRLAIRLGAQTNSRKSRAITAVGILGSDIYDKMLVLQALQPELPAAIFFTTDLDALYLEGVNQRYTRNLVVAAPEDIVVNSSLPPMRDNYQTILVRKIFELVGLPGSQSKPTPHVFEIAPGKTIDLKADSPASAHTPFRDFVLRQLSNPLLNLLIFCLALLNAFIVLAAIFTREAREEPPETMIAPMRPWARRLVYAEIILGILGIICILIFLGIRREKLLLGEPLALGVSIWPSVMIRLLAFLVAILLLLIASYTFVSQGKALREKLKDILPGDKQFPLPEGLVAESKRLFRCVADERPAPLRQQSFAVQLDCFFGAEQQPLWRKQRLWRIMGVSLGYFVLTAVLFSIWPPPVPGRGAFALLNEKIVLALGTSLYIIHLVFCLDLHIGAFNFLRALRAIYAPGSWKTFEREQTHRKAREILEATSAFTSIIGKTLLYPLTVLILIILSRLRQFDNWTMTPSLTTTFAVGAFALVAAAVILWLQGSRLKRQILANERRAEQKELEESTGEDPAVREKRLTAMKKKREELEAINDGVFAAWYNQPIFAAIFSAAAVFGSLSVAGPIARLFLA